MNTYKIGFYLESHVTVIIKAFCEEDAVAIAEQQSHRGKLPAVKEKGISIETGTVPLEGEDFGITVEKIK